MINISDCFAMCGQDNCIDVASSLGLQGVDSSMQEISIPIYEIFYLKILIGQDCAFICDSIPELTAIRNMNNSCGSVAVTVNIMDMDLLTLLGAILIFTPNTGMNVFIKLNAIDLVDEISDLLPMVADTVGIPIPDGFIDADMATEILQKVFDMLIEKLSADLEEKGINLMEWTELPGFYDQLRQSGEMQQMLALRRQLGAFTI